MRARHRRALLLYGSRRAKLIGRQYSVVAGGLSCASAKSYASELSFADPKTYVDTYQLNLLYNPAGKIFAKWPLHYTCAGTSYSLTRHKPPTISGYCWKGVPTEPYSLKTKALIEWRAQPS